MSTERLDNNTGTVRLDDARSTVRIDDTGTTQRLDDNVSAQMLEHNANTAPEAILQAKQDIQQESISDGKKTGELFSVGQSLKLRGKTYTIESVISISSGEAIIYKISHEGKPFVLKHYKLGNYFNDVVLQKFKDDPKDKIIKLIDYDNYNGQNFEIMEFAEGGSLDDYLKENGPIKNPDKLKDIVGQINRGLNQLHNELNIIYQDLKPENIYFRDKEKTSLILADFGISNVMEHGEKSAYVTANATTVYAAPDLARIGNQTQVIVGPAVDYFALGITMLHIWLGTKPFNGMNDAVRAQKINEKDVDFPADMPADIRILIQGLIEPLPKLRWGSQHIKRWIAGESLQSDYRKTSCSYESQMFNDTESYASPQELADLMYKYPQQGITYLYRGTVSTWLQNAGDNKRLEEIKSIISAFADNKEAGLYAATYTLDPSRPFITNGGKKCDNDTELADALMTESEYYMDALKNNDEFLYLNIIATGGDNGKIVAEKFQKYFSEYSPKRALTLVYLALQEDGGQSVSFGSKTYQSPEEAAEETDTQQIELIEQAIREEDSLFLVWLSNHYGDFFGSTKKFRDLPASDAFFLLSKFKFLSYKKLIPDWEDWAIFELVKLIQFNPHRHELFEEYVRQGLPFNGQHQTLDWGPTAVSYLVRFFDDITSGNYMSDNSNVGFELLRFLNTHGADVNEKNKDGSFPLKIAIYLRNKELVKILLELGSDPDEIEEYAPILWALFQNDDNEDEKIRMEIAELLIDHNANVNVYHKGNTPLRQALFFTHPAMVDFISRLIRAGANVNRRDSDGVTPLMQTVLIYIENKDETVRNNLLKVAELLLKNKAKTEVLNNEGYAAPLLRCGGWGLQKMANLLLKFGAKKDFADKDGNIAYVYAKQYNHHDLLNLLNPGFAFKAKAALYLAVKTVLVVLVLAGVFLTMDVLARAILSFNLIYPVVLGMSIVLSHLLYAYILIAILGFRKYLALLKGTFSFVSSGLFYAVGIPVLFPLFIALLQFLTRLLPENISMVLSLPVNIMTQSPLGNVILSIYLGFLAVLMGSILLYSKVTYKFSKIKRIYSQYS